MCRHLPAFRLATPGVAERITVRHLLTHTAGFVGDWFLVRPPTLAAGDDAPRRLADAMAEVPQLFPPGGGWSYNNAGFGLAGRVIEVLTGRPYEAALRDLVLGPLGLAGTFVSADEAITHRVALPHTSTTRPPRILRGAGWQPGWQLTRSDVPLGGLISSVEDLLGWARFHLGIRRPSAGPAPLAPRDHRRDAGASRHGRLLCRPGRCRVDAPDGRGRTLVGHGGLTTGYATVFTLVPEARAAVVVLTNATPGGTWLGREITRTCPARGHRRRRRAAGDGSGLGRRRARVRRPLRQPVRRPDVSVLARSRASWCWSTTPAHRSPADGLRPPPGPIRLAFYAKDRVVALAPSLLAGLRGEFGRDSGGRVAWLRWGGRLAPRLGD